MPEIDVAWQRIEAALARIAAAGGGRAGNGAQAAENARLRAAIADALGQIDLLIADQAAADAVRDR